MERRLSSHRLGTHIMTTNARMRAARLHMTQHQCKRHITGIAAATDHQRMVQVQQQSCPCSMSPPIPVIVDTTDRQSLCTMCIGTTDPRSLFRMSIDISTEDTGLQLMERRHFKMCL
mmetsp:Transcript_33972/g.79453  ORF Transcript_33972/g.79453 Transcript_33972/m.79453 type:complete len:117 (+) Transcript_33972:187-537(+)